MWTDNDRNMSHFFMKAYTDFAKYGYVIASETLSSLWSMFIINLKPDNWFFNYNHIMGRQHISMNVSCSPHLTLFRQTVCWIFPIDFV
jgi:hypothetical protein